MMLTKNIPYYARYAGVGLLLSAAAVQADISGKVFHDFNANGTFDTGTSFNEVGMAGVTVKAFDATGAQVGTAATTNADGSYTLTGLTASTDYRVEFSWAQSWLKPGTAGGTSVQFVKDGTTGVNMAVGNPGQYCQSNPTIVTSELMSGASNQASTFRSILGWPYDASGTVAANPGVITTLSNKNQTGAVYGLAYSRTEKRLFASALLKRHVGLLGSDAGNLGAIYAVDPFSGVANASLWLDVTTLGINVGAIGSDTARGLGAYDSASHDDDAFDAVGKRGIGDIEISDDEKTIYFTNLYDKKVYAIDIASKSLSGSWTITGVDCGTYSPDHLRINSGSETNFTDSKGHTWLADVMYRQSWKYSNAAVIDTASNAITGTSDAGLYATYNSTKHSNTAISYNIPVKTGTTYTIKLHFAEPTKTAAGQRTFNIDIENVNVTSGFDIFSEAGGKNRAIVKTFTGQVVSADGVLNIDLLKPGAVEADRAIISGVEVINENPAAINVAAGEYRPFGLSFHNGSVFVGGVCTAETSQNEDQMQGFVHRIDAGGAATRVLNFPLNYTKANVYSTDAQAKGWHPWVSGMAGMKNDGPDMATYQQPILADIEFDEQGYMILGFIDRLALQLGKRNYGVSGEQGVLITGEAGGDILMAAPNSDTSYTLENNKVVGLRMGSGSNNQGPGGSEFFNDTIRGGHNEQILGSLILLPGSGEVAATGYALLNDYDNGVAFLSTTNGNYVDRFQVALPSVVGKSGGLGDIEMLCDPAPIEIGNRVWHDIDSDGIQDADEPGIDSVEVKLFCGSSGTEWATTTTSNGGLFRFTNAAGGNALFMDYGEDCTLWVDNNQIALSTYSLTDQDADNITDNNALTDLRDSDAATNASMAEIKFTVGKAGENNHTLDFGYKPTPNETRSIGNRVWFDTNNNGTADVGESPVGAGVKLELKNAAGDVLQSATTDANGHYVFAGLAYSPTGYQVCLTADNFTAGGLLENHESSTGFTDPNTTAVDGDDSGDDNESDGVCSTVVMLDHNEPTGELGIDGNYDGNDGAGTLDFLSDLTVDFGVVASTPSFPPPPGPSAMSCTADTRLATSIHVNGDSQAAGSTGASVNGLITFDYAATGELAAPFSKGTAGQVGSVWGLAYDVTRKKLYTSAFLKRHASFGPGGVGAIYQMDGRSASATPSLLIDLAANGVDLGSSPRTLSNGVVDDPNELPADASQPSWDRDAFAQIGKISLGDIDISADGNILWAVNLKQRELVEINLTNTTVTAKHAIPDPGCSNGEFRPWAVKVHDGKVWVGSICSAETSQQAADLKAYVQAFDGTTFTTATSFALNYPKGSVGNGPGDEKWQPWTSTFQTLASGEFAIYPQPILSDIEFDMDGSLILGFMDRMGHQVGGVNYTPNYPDDNTMIQGQTGGDIIRVCNNGGKYELENNATCTSGSTAGKDKGQGPGNGEYYWGEMWDFNPWNADGGFHQETSFGGLAFKAGSGEIALTAMNPLNPNANAGGVIWLDNATGGRSANAGVQVYRQQGAGSPYFGKAAGMGDLEIFCAEAPPVTHSIGNRIWFDTNNNGTADSGEQHAGNGIKLELKDSTGNAVLQTTTTDANGRYLFHGLTAGNYQVCVTADNFAAGSKLEKYRSSTGQADTEGFSTDGTDRGDDNLSNGSCSTIIVLDDKEPTGEYGITDQQDGADGQGTPDTHSNLMVDFGFVPPTDLKLVKTVDKASAKRGDMLTYTLTLSNESNTVATGVNVTDNLPAGVEIMGNPVASQGSFDKVTRIWNIGTVTANSTVTLSLSVEVK